MGFMGNLLGFGDNPGMNFQAQSVPLDRATNTDQTLDAYNRSQLGLGRQKSFLDALNAQNGIGNQMSVFNQQQALANQLQGVANGTGPNPALQQLQNTTGQNVANQAALMAGQRGSGANAGLMARQIGMQGANIQQQAVGQGAAMSAQQQLAAMGALQNQQNMMGGLASTQVGQQGSALGTYNQAAQNEQQQLLNALAQYNQTNVSQQNAINNANAGIANTTAQGQQGLLGGVLGGIGSLGILKGAAPAAAALAHGGMISGYADGGNVGGPQSFAGKFLNGWSSTISPQEQNPIQSMGSQNVGASALNRGMNSFSSGLAQGLSSMFSSPQPNQNSSMATSIPGVRSAEFAQGGPIVGEMLASQGKMVPGKAKASGDNLKNDVVPAMLSPGEVVIPRSVMQSEDPIGNSAKFVQAVLAKNGMRK